MLNFINETKENYYKERKKLSFRLNSYNSLKKPSWMEELNHTKFEATYNDQEILMRQGRVAIGSVVQANFMLFKPGRYNCPAAMVFSEDPYFYENPYKLEDIASKLFEIKGEATNDEELQKFSDILEDEKEALFNVKLPKKITFGKEVYFTTFMVHREHIPNGYIDFKSFPVLIYPEQTEASIILPSRYWFSEYTKKKKKVKILTNQELMKLLDENPERYIEVIQKHIEYSFEKMRSSWFRKDKWLIKNYYYRINNSTALMNCGQYMEAKEVIDDLLLGIDMNDIEENQKSLNIILFISLIDTLIGLERFEEAKGKIRIFENIISNCKDEKNIQAYSSNLKWKCMKLDILDGDLERGGCYLKELIKVEESKVKLGEAFMYLGIYHFKRSEEDKSLEFFNRASDIVKSPDSLRKIQYYKNILT
ncbi:hypothetical protein NNC19_05560 [Clostridium sp. SHJSY1]|uniref:hypothetical protein n=1 Tax=Clostridium sp. SHJSY1 TaxID=2942483 RepID=UPI002874680D|nr:hypothetical protein [Clostridium sp. SHJSY1]MDS0525141.1 hypothetical protein [Clostridium sp. SHJSY1]